MKALACGIDKVLSDYRQALLKLEQKVSRTLESYFKLSVTTWLCHLQCILEPYLPLSFMQSQLEQFQLLLPALEACVRHVTSERCQGPQVLSYLHDQCLSGVPIVKTSFER